MIELTKADEKLFWYWISERHAIYLRRQAGKPKPWTTDPILRDYKFTNPFRENDRGTVWLRENFLKPHRDDDLGLIAFNICWYRMFNWIGTGERLGWQTGWDTEQVKASLNLALASGRQVFTGAHIIYSRPGLSKIDAIVNVCENLWEKCVTGGTVTTCAQIYKSLQRTYDELRTVDSVGGFMAYEMVTDMRHTRLLEDATDIMTWANPGPGAQRGLRRLGLPSKPDAKAIESMRGLLQRSNRSDSLPPPEEWPHIMDLEMRDIEHSLCEFDKYCRTKFGEGQPRSMYPGAA